MLGRRFKVLAQRRRFRGAWCVVLVAVFPSLALGQTGKRADASSTRPAGTKPGKPLPSTPPKRSLADLVPPGGQPEEPFRISPLPSIRDDEVRGLGIRRIDGKHVILYTDLPVAAEVDELPHVFDAAVPQWCAYFQVALEKAAGWKNVAYLIQDKERFRRAALIPADLPPFLNGFQRGAELWVHEQPSGYYRRHLLLHEGTHAFMMAALGGAGPPWYMEGTAELLATHRWQDGQLVLNYLPRTKEEVPEWGRIKIVRDAYRRGEARQLGEILLYDTRAHLQVEPYGWSWAAAAFLDGHPVYQQRFRELRKYARDTESSFSERFLGWLRDDWNHLSREWQVFVSRLDYGYDIAREAIEPKLVVPLPAEGATVAVAAARGWQSTGFRLEAGQRYRIEAEGRYQLGTQPRIWWCEPNGVTIRYVGGRPLGMLLGAIIDENAESGHSNGFLTAAGIGMGLETTLRRGGTLYLRVNEDAAELADNQGDVRVRLTAVP